MTCNGWRSSEFGKAMLGHIDRTGLADNDYARSWNSSHQSRGCSQADLIAGDQGTALIVDVLKCLEKYGQRLERAPRLFQLDRQ